MAMVKRASTIAVMILCLALVNVEGGGGGRRGGGRGGGGKVIGDGVPETVFNVVKYGAIMGKSNPNLDNADAFMSAWVDACQEFTGIGRSRLLIPAGVFQVGEVVFGGPCKSKFPATIELVGTVVTKPDLSAYTTEGLGWINLESINGLVITGGGTFDAQGPLFYHYNDCKKNPTCVHLPPLLHTNNVQNLKISRVNFANGMGFHLHIAGCKNVRIQGVKITAPADSPNTDGMHISKSSGVKVARTIIKTGDDCISFGQGSTNITLNKIVCGPGHGISVGSLGKYPMEDDVSGLIVKNSTLIGTTNGIRIKTYSDTDPSKAFGMLFTDIIMDNVKNPIIIDQGYGNRGSSKPSSVKISNVIYQNIKGTTTSEVAVNLDCSRQYPCENVRFSNIDIKSLSKNVARPGSICTNAKVMYSGLQGPTPCSH